MKVIHVSFSDLQGGASRAAYRIHRALYENAVDSRMVVAVKKSKDKSVTKFQVPFISKKVLLSQQIIKLQKRTNPSFHSLNLFPSGLSRKLNESDADIVHLHWINGELISIGEISRLNKPVVWTMHDMWPISGTEHYDNLKNPGRYARGYTKATNYNEGMFDLDQWIWNRKYRHWAMRGIGVVAPSRWLGECIRLSKIFSKSHVEVIPYPIDLDVYHPIPKSSARRILKLPIDKKLILFGSASKDGDLRKGSDLLYDSLDMFFDSPGSEGVELVVFGPRSISNIKRNKKYSIHNLSRLYDDVHIALAYSAADLFVAPSRQDNLPNTIIESLSSGTPCVAFNIGGIPDMISHKLNGYLASPFDVDDLTKGMAWCLQNSDSSSALSHECRNSAEIMFSSKSVARKYLELYRSKISGN